MIYIIKKALVEAFLRNDNSKYTIYGNICIAWFAIKVHVEDQYEEEIERYTNIHSERLTSFNQIQELADLTIPKLHEDIDINSCVRGSDMRYGGINYIKI